MGLGLLTNGEWIHERTQEDSLGRFIRPSATFRNWITADGSSGWRAEADRYHLYISWACPWAHRTVIMRHLKGLEAAIGLSVVHPVIEDNGWEFSEDYPGCVPDTVNHKSYLWEVYLQADPDYSGRVTVPVLWDKKTGTIVNNESREIVRMLDTEFASLAKPGLTFYPAHLREVIDQTIDAIYQPINNGVYRAGFAASQEAYEEAIRDLFAALDHWEAVLAQQPFLCGDRLTEVDWFLFTTLIRFDLVYYIHFKCSLRRLTDYSNLWNYVRQLYQWTSIRDQCNFNHIKRHYYRSHPKVNPTRIVPVGPLLDFDLPHDRHRFKIEH